MLNDDAMYDAMDALVSVGLLVDAVMVTDSTTVPKFDEGCNVGLEIGVGVGIAVGEKLVVGCDVGLNVGFVVGNDASTELTFFDTLGSTRVAVLLMLYSLWYDTLSIEH